MFWDVFSDLCKRNNVKPSVVSKSIGLSDVIPTKWKNGALPKAEILLKLSEYFNCSVDYLLTGKENTSDYNLPTSNSLEYTDHYVAFLDILGFSNYVKNDNTKFSDVKKIYNIYSYIKVNNSSINQGPAFSIDQMSKLKFNSISDTIVISIPKDEERSLEMLVFAVDVMIFNLLLNCNLFLRGAISEGKFYSNDRTNLLFGPALINAAKLEKSTAIYPRIVILPELIANYEASLSKENKGAIKELIKIEQIENDSLYIVNYVKYILERLALDDAKIMRQKLNDLIVFAEKNLYSIDDVQIRKKWLYFQNYFNNEVDASNEYLYCHFESRKINVENIFGVQEKTESNSAIHPLQLMDIKESTKYQKEKSSSSELSEEEQECIDKFNQLNELDKARIIERMNCMIEGYTPEMKENA